MTETTTDGLDLDGLRRAAEAATPGPWQSLEDGNQYIGAKYMPTVTLLPAAVIPQLVRPWNPHAYIAFGHDAKEHETVRLKSADAAYIAAVNPRTVTALLDRLRAAERQLQKWEAWQPDDEDLAAVQQQARAKDGSYTNGLAAQAIYIGHLEHHLRQTQAARAAADAERQRAKRLALLLVEARSALEDVDWDEYSQPAIEKLMQQCDAALAADSGAAGGGE